MVDWNLPVDHPTQPHIVQLAGILCDDDDACSIIKQFQTIIKPDGWEIQEEAARIHGISRDYAWKFGEKIDDAFKAFNKLIAQADGSGDGRLIGHNVTFDIRMMLREYSTLPVHDHIPINNLLPFCTMKSMTNVCRIPHPTRRSGYKWPKLMEAYYYCFNAEFPNVHTALGDTLACRDIFVHGRRQGWWR